MTVKKCQICGREFEGPNHKLYCSPDCKKEASKIRSHNHYMKNREKYLEMGRIWRKEHPDYLKKDRETKKVDFPCMSYSLYDGIPVNDCLNCTAPVCRFEESEK